VRLTRDRFVALRRARWEALESLLASDAKLHRRAPRAISELAALYRAVSADLMRARALGLGLDVISHLNSLSSRAHNLLYGAKPLQFSAFVEFLTRGFPSSVRRAFWPCFIASLTFYGPFALGLFATLQNREFALLVLPPEALEQMAEAYAQGFDAGRDESTDSAMAGFYVYNNVGIAFRCFATGILFGAGSIFFLFSNGLSIGCVLGHVIASGSGSNILTFVSGHGAFELTAIVIAGGAGLKMGYALIATGGRTRIGSLRAEAPELATLVAGAAVFLLVAAGIEAFWSPSSAPREVKWVVAALLWLFVFGYLLLGGRDFGLQRARRAPAPRDGSHPASRSVPPPPLSEPPPPSSRSFE
jgi:uncharacterized membrane protein SpoIIM required for sporulation